MIYKIIREHFHTGLTELIMDYSIGGLDLHRERIKLVHIELFRYFVMKELLNLYIETLFNDDYTLLIDWIEGESTFLETWLDDFV